MNQSDIQKLTQAVKQVLSLMVRDGLTQVKVSPKMMHDMAKLGNVRLSGMRSAIASVLADPDIHRGGWGRYGVCEAIGPDAQSEDLLIVKQNNANTIIMVDGVLKRRANAA